MNVQEMCVCSLLRTFSYDTYLICCNPDIRHFRLSLMTWILYNLYWLEIYYQVKNAHRRSKMLHTRAQCR